MQEGKLIIIYLKMAASDFIQQVDFVAIAISGRPWPFADKTLDNKHSKSGRESRWLWWLGVGGCGWVEFVN